MLKFTGKERERKRRREDEEEEQKQRERSKQKFRRDQRAEFMLGDVPSTAPLTVGTIVLGAISKITAFDMQVWIPGGNVGYLSRSDVSDIQQSKALSTFFKVGNLIRCIIKSHEDSEIQLSARESHLNATLHYDALMAGSLISGSVKSIEDHGYFISLGSEKQVGFLPKKEVGTYLEDVKRKDLVIGEPLILSVTSVRSSSVTLSLANFETNRDAVVEDRDQSFEDIPVRQITIKRRLFILLWKSISV
jgi:rRNA biogenesis protein RRP5